MSVEEAVTSVATHEMVLQLVTERQVHAFDLGDTFRVGLGRHHSNEVELRSMKVSKHHAEILNEVEGLFLQDKGSTNGTFLNDETVKRARLNSGDRIRIGSFELSVRLLPRSSAGDVPVSGGDDGLRVGAIGNILPFQATANTLRGVTKPDDLDLTLPDVLSRLAAKRASVTVILKNQSEQGRMYIEDGAIIHAEAGATRRAKALFRLLNMTKGTYEIQLFPEMAVPHTIDTPTGQLVIEGMLQLEALEKISAQLPPVVNQIVLDGTCDIPVSTLTEEELDIYTDIVRHKTLVRVLEESPHTDFTILRIAHGLLAKGFFKATRSKGRRLEQTAFTRVQAS